MPDGRLYLYGSWDLEGNTAYCSKELHVFSTSDLENWTDHGVIFRNDSTHAGIPWQPDTALYAPDAIHRKGKYHLYLCGCDSAKGFEGMAVADSPVGPFSDAEKIEIANGDGIDPAVFVDENGRAYLFWGQYTLRGGELREDMKTLVPESVNRALLTEWEHGFHEGASLRKREGKYYLIYTDVSRGKATCLSYAIADKPLGPYRKGGVIIDNQYCDPKTWNNHGSIACYRGQWYVFYHRSSRNSETNRRVCVEKIAFDKEGHIAEVIPTSQGASPPIKAVSPIKAASACRMMKQVYVTRQAGREILRACGLSHWDIPDWAEYRYIDFQDGGYTHVTVSVQGKGKITLKAENDFLLGSGTVSSDSDSFEEVSFPINAPQGIHALWLFFEGSLDLYAFWFGKYGRE